MFTNSGWAGTRLPILPFMIGLAVAGTAVAHADTPAPTAGTQPVTAAQAPTPASRSGWPFEGVFTIGGIATDTTGSPSRVGEYQVVDQEALPQFGLQFWGERGRSRWDVGARHSGDARDQAYFAELNVARRLKLSAEYSRLPHRLDHDPLGYMDASSNIGGTFVVRHTDTDPTATYGLTTGELRSRAELALPFEQGNVRFFLGHRQQMRDGHHQSLTTNHCATCHTVSYTREVDQRLRDLTAGARLQYNAVTLDYSYEDREFEERGDGLTHVYDRARQPATLAEVFLNRVSYDARSGSLPFDTTPGLSKGTHVLRGRLSLPKDAVVTGNFTRSESTNTDLDLNTVFTGGSGRFSMPLGRRFTLRGGIRHYEIESDSIFVDVAEPVAPAGPSAGLTYAQNFPALGSVDFLRESGLNRSPTIADVEGIWRPAKKTTVRLGYEWNQLEREHFEIEKTVTNTFRVSARSAFGRSLQTQTRLRIDTVEDPFGRPDAAVPATLQPFQSPGNVPFKPALQYFEFYRTRSVDLSSYPSLAIQVDETATWSPSPRVSISGSYRFRDASNEDLGSNTWDQTMHMPGAQIYVAPADRWSLAAGYTYQRERTKTLFSTLSFVG